MNKNKPLKRHATVVVLPGVKAPGLKPGTRGTLLRTWPEDHPYHKRYYVVRFGEGAQRKDRVLARAIIKVA